MKPAFFSVRFVAFATVAVCVVWPHICRAQVPERKTVLVLHAYGSQSPFRPLLDRALENALAHNGIEDADLYVETLESNRVPGSTHAALFQNYLGQKYAGRKID